MSWRNQLYRCRTQTLAMYHFHNKDNEFVISYPPHIKFALRYAQQVQSSRFLQWKSETDFSLELTSYTPKSIFISAILSSRYTSGWQTILPKYCFKQLKTISSRVAPAVVAILKSVCCYGMPNDGCHGNTRSSIDLLGS